MSFLKMKKIHEDRAYVEIIDDFLSSKCFKFLNSLDKQITTNLIECEIRTRPVNDNGLWCIFLIPSVLLSNDIVHEVSHVYSLVTYISMGLLFYCCLFIIFMAVTCLVLKESVYGGCVASCFVSTLLIYTFLQQGLTYSFMSSAISVYGYTLVVRHCITSFPKTFTVGEAMIVSQALVLFVSMSVAKLFNRGTDDDVDLISAVVDTVLATVAMIVAAIYYMPASQKKDINNLVYILTMSVPFAFILLHMLLGYHSIELVTKYLFLDINRLKLSGFWLFLVCMSGCVLLIRTKLAVKASTVTRKTFHILASTVFLSGIVYDVHLITLASGIGLGLMFFAEALRLSGIEPMSSALQSAFLIFKDEKDCGSFAMTPMYLFCGLACPLLLVPSHNMRLELLSGVLSVGIGDTAASWFGSRYGFNKWPNSSKSLEGTTFNVLSQVLAVYALQVFELLESRNALFRTAIAGTLSALVEAKTEQVDNLLLPLVTLLGFQLTTFMGTY